MLDYRLYFLDGGGRIDRVQPFTATGDDDARAHAEVWAKKSPYELWCGPRMVAKSPPDRR